MKKVLTLLCTSLIVFLMFVDPGNPVEAAKNSADNVTYLGPPLPGEVEDPGNDDCTCHDLLPLKGSERNKIVAEVLKSDVFKNEKMRLKKDGYKWHGASGIEVIQPTEDFTLVGVPFLNNGGTIEMHTFLIGDFQDFIDYISTLHNQTPDEQQ
jgi:hypothetical protein